MIINYQIWCFSSQTKGELHPERKEAFEKAQKAYEKLLANTSSLAVSTVKKSNKLANLIESNQSTEQLYM